MVGKATVREEETTGVGCSSDTAECPLLAGAEGVQLVEAVPSGEADAGNMASRGGHQGQRCELAMCVYHTYLHEGTFVVIHSSDTCTYM